MRKSIAAICIVISLLSLSACSELENKGTVKVASTAVSKAAISKAATPPAAQSAAPKEAVVGVGQTLDYDGLQFTLDSVETYTDTSDYPLDKADEGSSFVLLRFTVANNTKEDDHVNMFYEDSYCDDTAIDPEALLINVKGKTIWGDVAVGKKRSGYVAYAVPDGWKTLEFYYNPEIFGGDSSKMMFKVTPEDIAK